MTVISSEQILSYADAASQSIGLAAMLPMVPQKIGVIAACSKYADDPWARKLIDIADNKALQKWSQPLMFVGLGAMAWNAGRAAERLISNKGHEGDVQLVVSAALSFAGIACRLNPQTAIYAGAFNTAALLVDGIGLVNTGWSWKSGQVTTGDFLLQAAMTVFFGIESKSRVRVMQVPEEISQLSSYDRLLPEIKCGRDPIEVVNAFLTGRLSVLPTQNEVYEICRAFSKNDEMRHALITGQNGGQTIFQIYTREFIDGLSAQIELLVADFSAQHSRLPVIREVAAGNGMLSRWLNVNLQPRGCKVIATDLAIETEWSINFESSIVPMDAIDAARGGDIILGSWWPSHYAEGVLPFDIPLAEHLLERPEKVLVLVSTDRAQMTETLGFRGLVEKKFDITLATDVVTTSGISLSGEWLEPTRVKVIRAKNVHNERSKNDPLTYFIGDAECDSRSSRMLSEVLAHSSHVYLCGYVSVESCPAYQAPAFNLSEFSIFEGNKHRVVYQDPSKRWNVVLFHNDDNLDEQVTHVPKENHTLITNQILAAMGLPVIGVKKLEGQRWGADGAVVFDEVPESFVHVSELDSSQLAMDVYCRIRSQLTDISKVLGKNGLAYEGLNFYARPTDGKVMILNTGHLVVVEPSKLYGFLALFESRMISYKTDANIRAQEIMEDPLNCNIGWGD